MDLFCWKGLPMSFLFDVGIMNEGQAHQLLNPYFDKISDSIPVSIPVFIPHLVTEIDYKIMQSMKKFSS